MSLSLPTGVLPALLTPFTDEEDVNWPMLDRVIEHLLDAGVDGLYVGGASSECFYLSMAERKQLTERALAATAGSAPVIVHVACGATRDALELARHAERAGAAAIASMPPYFFKVSFDEVLGFYRELAGAVGIPVLAYYLPALTGVDFTPAQFDALAAVPNVAGIKFTSSQLNQIVLLKEHRARPVVYNGYDEMLLAGLAMGADGGIGSYYNLVPEVVVALWRAFQRADLESARDCQRKLTQLIHWTLEMGGSSAFKVLMASRGLDCGNRRAPSQRIPEATRRRLFERFEQWQSEYASGDSPVVATPAHQM